MISKRIEGKYKGKQGTKNVINYVADKAIENMTNYATNKTENAWYINLPNDKELAIAKMQNTQAMNTTTTTSKIYHYVVTFNNGEKPNDEVMQNIEKTISEALGYKEYQRVVAIHDDTAHYHMHIVVNTIHPNKHINRNSPSNDYYIRNDTMRMLEKKYNLVIDKGIERQKQNKNYKAIDFEAHTGLESFTSYLKKEIKETAINVKDWQELHKESKKIGVIVKLQGNGLVFKSIDSKVTVKSSTIDRKLSKSNLEKKLGNFKEFENINTNKNYLEAPKIDSNYYDHLNYIECKDNSLEWITEEEKTYKARPIHKKTNELWEKYLKQKENRKKNFQDKKLILNKVFELQNNIVKEIWNNKNLAYKEKKELNHQLNITTIKNKYNVYTKNLDDKSKHIYEKAQDKFITLEILKYNQLQNIQNKFLSIYEKQQLIIKTQEIYKQSVINIKNEIKKEFMHNTHNSHSWIDFLREEVKNNNPKALKILQSAEKRASDNNIKKPYIAGVKVNNILLENAKIGKNGTITYETKDGGLFTDEKNKITILKNTPQAQEQSYSLAKQQFEHTMIIKGNLEYWKKQVQQGLER